MAAPKKTTQRWLAEQRETRRRLKKDQEALALLDDALQGVQDDENAATAFRRYYRRRYKTHPEIAEWRQQVKQQAREAKRARQKVLEAELAAWAAADEADPPDDAVTDEDVAEARVRDFRTRVFQTTERDYRIVFGELESTRGGRANQPDVGLMLLKGTPETGKGGYGIETYPGPPPPRQCECGCGETITDARKRSKKFINPTHRQRLHDRKKARAKAERARSDATTSSRP
jgi:hypothetical protein